MGMTSTSEVMLCFPQNPTFSGVSALPPRGEPENLRVRSNCVLSAEVEHLLGFCYAPDERTRKAAACKDESEDGDSERFLRRTHHGDVAVAAKQLDVGVDVVFGGDGVEDEVEAAGVLGHLIRVARDDNLIGAEAKSVVLFGGRRGEDDRVGTEGVRELDAHVAEAAEADDANLLALGHAPVAHRSEGDTFS